MKTFRFKSIGLMLLSLVLAVSLGACGSQNASGSAGSSSQEGQTSSSGSNAADNLSSDRDISSSLTFQKEEKTDYAEQFSIYDYENGYKLINISDGTRYLVVPEGASAPPDLDSDIVVLQQPVEHIYLAASAAMDMFASMDAVDTIDFSGEKEENWYISEAAEAMKEGRMSYAGKYNTPDYELLLDGGCDLAIENTMILHTPEVREKLIETGIPVIVDHSSYETHPLGRTEWIKLYGAITGHESEAESAYSDQKKQYEEAASGSSESEKCTVAYFSINSNGAASVRKSDDYVPEMIAAAGGKYIPDDLTDGKHTSTTTLSIEEFYKRAHDADILVYNSTIEGSVSSIDDLLKKAPSLKNFKAVKNGNVWCTSQNMYQASMEAGTITADFHSIITDQDVPDSILTYMKKLK